MGFGGLVIGDIPFNKRFEFKHEEVEQLSPLIRRIVANNPNFFTFHGTNTYILGRGKVALIDPGPDIPAHIEAISKSLEGEVVTHIFVTHTHIDHWPAYGAFRTSYGAKTYCFDGERPKRHEVVSDIEIKTLSNQEKYELTGFSPDIAIQPGETINGAGWTIECVYTPGHASNHVCFQLKEEKTLFSGDHVMGWSTSVISPPSGNMEDYMMSLELLLDRNDETYLPDHGPAIKNPVRFVKSFIDHRVKRENQIIGQLEKGVVRIRDMVPVIYNDIPVFLHPAAERSVLATVIYLIKRGEILCEGQPTVISPLSLA